MIKIVRPMKSQSMGFISKKLNRWLSVSTKGEPRLSWLISQDQIWFYKPYSRILSLHRFVLLERDLNVAANPDAPGAYGAPGAKRERLRVIFHTSLSKLIIGSYNSSYFQLTINYIQERQMFYWDQETTCIIRSVAFSPRTKGRGFMGYRWHEPVLLWKMQIHLDLLWK